MNDQQKNSRSRNPLKRRKTLNLIADFRGINPSQTDKCIFKQPIPIEKILSISLKRYTPSQTNLDNIGKMRLQWRNWFKNPLLSEISIEKLDTNKILFLRVPNVILKQQLQFLEAECIQIINEQMAFTCVKKICWVIRQD